MEGVHAHLRGGAHKTPKGHERAPKGIIRAPRRARVGRGDVHTWRGGCMLEGGHAPLKGDVHAFEGRTHEPQGA
jgi:hypothetical protein